MKQVRPIETEAEKLLELARGREVIALQDIQNAGLSRTCAYRLVRNGHLEKIGRGLYRRPDAPISEHHDLIMVMSQTDVAVVALISALYFHKLGTQIPRAVWIQISSSTRVIVAAISDTIVPELNAAPYSSKGSLNTATCT